jgi:hypothetical protein
MTDDIKKDFVSEEEALSPSEEQNRLLRLNLETSREILEKIKPVRSYVKWQNLWSTVRTLIILVPIIFGFLYLPNFVKNYVNQLVKVNSYVQH